MSSEISASMLYVKEYNAKDYIDSHQRNWSDRVAVQADLGLRVRKDAFSYGMAEMFYFILQFD